MIRRKIGLDKYLKFMYNQNMQVITDVEKYISLLSETDKERKIEFLRFFQKNHGVYQSLLKTGVTRYFLNKWCKEDKNFDELFEAIYDEVTDLMENYLEFAYQGNTQEKKWNYILLAKMVYGRKTYSYYRRHKNFDRVGETPGSGLVPIRPKAATIPRIEES